MKALIQRVKSASVEIEGEIVGSIDQGLLAFIGVEQHDDKGSADKLLAKLLHYRVFSDDLGKMNLGLDAISGGLLLVSQFTLAADTQTGLRPSFSRAANPELAESLYNYLRSEAKSKHANTHCGVFAADMQVSLINDGPVTFLLQV